MSETVLGVIEEPVPFDESHQRIVDALAAVGIVRRNPKATRTRVVVGLTNLDDEPTGLAVASLAGIESQ
jgi:hypothetical protein